MRWNTKTQKEKKPVKPGDIRLVRRFLWLPLYLPITPATLLRLTKEGLADEIRYEWRWLEKCQIFQVVEFKPVPRTDLLGCSETFYTIVWRDLFWINPDLK